MKKFLLALVCLISTSIIAFFVCYFTIPIVRVKTNEILHVTNSDPVNPDPVNPDPVDPDPVDPEPVAQKLTLPTPLVVDKINCVLEIPHVVGATAYNLSFTVGDQIDDVIIANDVTSYNFSSYVSDGLIIQLFAVGDGVTYLDSDGVSYELHVEKIATPEISISGSILTVSNLDIHSDFLAISVVPSSGTGTTLNYPFVYESDSVEINLNREDFNEFYNRMNFANGSYNVCLYAAPIGGCYTYSDDSNIVILDYNWAPVPVKLLNACEISYNPDTLILTINSVKPDDLGYVSCNIQLSNDGVNFRDNSGTNLNSNSLNYRLNSWAYANYHYIRVMLADSSGIYSAVYSNVIEYTYNGIPLDVPTLSYDENSHLLSWATQGVGANYIIFICEHGTYNQVYSSSLLNDGVTSLDLSTLNLAGGTYDISIGVMSDSMQNPQLYYGGLNSMSNPLVVFVPSLMF